MVATIIDFVKRLLWREEQKQQRVTGVGFIRVTKGPFAMVDAEDLHLSRYTWTLCRGRNGRYAQGWGNGKMVLMHRFIAKTPTGFHTHHVDRDTFNNRRRNLANVTPKAHAALREAA